MRDYYYLTELDKSPYEICLADALHLGATNRLPVYVFFNSYITMTATSTGKEVEDSNVYLLMPIKVLSSMEKLLVEKTRCALNLVYAFADHRYSGNFSSQTSSKQACQNPVPVKLLTDLPADFGTHRPFISTTDLLCVSEDLEKLVKKGDIKYQSRRNDDLPENFRAMHDAFENGELRDVEALLIAWGKFWKNADKTDKDTWPRKNEVTNWLIEKGLSAKNADSGATIIKPQWAKDQGR